jgi:hypothetical protein
MSRIGDMVKELCPDGFERVPLGSFATQYVEPVRVQPDATYINLGVQFHGQGAFARGSKLGSAIKATTLYRVKAGQFIYNRMFVIEGSFAIVTSELADGVVSNEFPVYDLDSSRVLPEWLRLYFQDEYTLKRIAPEVTGIERGGTKSRRRWKEEQAEAFVVDLPPIPVQREIVRTLNVFAELETELRAELAARQRQSAYYRDVILNFESNAKVNWDVLGNVAKVRYGRDFPRSQQGRDTGEVPFFKVSDMTRPGNEVILASASNYVDASELASLGGDLAPAGTVLFPRIGAAVATNKKRLMVQPGAFDTSFMGLAPGPDIHPPFLLRWMTTVDLRTLSNSGGALPSVRRPLLEALSFPLISLPEQKRIADILDKFDTLVNDRSSGLPAEIAARRKQYEYYRGRLLTFKELAVV